MWSSHMVLTAQWLFGSVQPGHIIQWLSGGGLGLERCLGRAYQFAKQLFAFHRQRRQLFAIEFNSSLVQGTDKAAVAHAMLAHQRVNPGDPEGAEIPLLLLAIAIRVGQSLFQGTARLFI